MATAATTITSSPVRTGLYIGGEERETAETLAIADPAKPGVVVGYAAAASPQDVGDAVAAAKAAFPAWAALTPQERAAQMLAAMEGIAGARPRRGRRDPVAGERQDPPRGLDRRAGVRDPLAARADDSPTRSTPARCSARSRASRSQTTVSYQPLGVVTVIVPFNWPIAILGASLPHALLAGNTAIVKPPPSAPLATTRVVQRVAEKLPPGVLNVDHRQATRTWPA